MVEAMVALVLVDALLQQKAQCELFPLGETFGQGDSSSAPAAAAAAAAPAANKLGKKLSGYGPNL